MTKRDILNRSIESIDDLVIVLAEWDLLAEAYSRYGLEEPNWLSARRKEAKIELEARKRVANERELIELELKLENLKTPSERRDDILRKIARLKGTPTPEPVQTT